MNIYASYKQPTKKSNYVIKNLVVSRSNMIKKKKNSFVLEIA